MKKRFASTVVLAALLASAVLCGCADNTSGSADDSPSASSSSSSKEKRYVINSPDGRSVTTYTLDTVENRTTRSVVLGADDETITRDYVYTGSGELSEVRSTSSRSGTSVIRYQVESGRADNRKTKKTISITGTRGDTDIVEAEYIYDDDGSPLGVIQRDSNGNVYEKGVMD